MAQIVKIIDLSKSYLPGDPNAVTNNLHYTESQDSPDKTIALIPYEGYNFLPTAYGYRSYFGSDSSITLEALPTPCDEIVVFQSQTYENTLIAFCSDGIRTARAGATTWILAVSLPDDWTTSSIYRQYTWTIIENILYIYRQGYANVIKIDSDVVITEFTPSFLNMSGQIGIFRGNGRLCFWDSANSVAWSSAFDVTDFTPSIENLVGNSIFLGVLGRIVNIIPHGDGFIIYCTRSIVGVLYVTTGSSVWEASVIVSSTGITHPKAVCVGSSDREHFVYSTTGIYTIGAFNANSSRYQAEMTLAELYDFLRESRNPVYLNCHAGRFLYFSVIDDYYINGITSFAEVFYPSLTAPAITLDTSLWTTYTALPYITPSQTFQMFDSRLWSGTDITLTDRTKSIYETPTYCAVFNLPNYKSQANSLGKFTNAGGFLKHSEPTTSDIDPISKISEIFNAYNIYSSVTNAVANGTSKIAQVLNTDAKNMNSHVSYNFFSSQSKVWTEERSYIPKLYPQDILASGNSCEDLMYNFIDAVLEYESFCRDNYTKILGYINTINDNGPYTRLIYSESPLTITSSQLSTFSLIPTGGLTVTAGLGSLPTPSYLGVPQPSVTINAEIANYVKINQDTSNRNLVNTNTVHALKAAPVYKATLVEMFGQNPVGIGVSHTFTSPPTSQEVLDAFADPSKYLIGLGYQGPAGASYQLVFDPEKFRGTNNTITEGWVTCKNVATGIVYTNFKLIVNLLSESKTASLNYLETWSNTTDITSYYEVCPYATRSTFLMSYTNTQNCFNPTLEWQWIWSVFRANTLTYVAEATGLTYEISRTITPTITRHTDGALFLNAGIRLNGAGNAFFMATVYIFKPYMIYEYEVEEDIFYAATPTTLNTSGVRNTENEYLASFSLHFTQVGSETVSVSDGVVSVNPKTTIFTPSVVDPGVGTRLTFYPENRNEGAYWHIPTLKTPIIQDGIPWTLTDSVISNSSTNLVKGQHFMYHQAGKMLAVEQPIGPVYDLDDSWTSCYPGLDLDADGWVTGEVAPWTYPGGSFIIQDGTPTPGYPTLAGSLIFDMELKKWGKYKGNFRALIEYSPLNSTDNTSISTSNFGVDSGILAASDSKLKLFSQRVSNSYIRYGKLALYRLGFTHILEVNINFRTAFTGDIIIDGSVDNKHLELGIQHKESFTNTRNVRIPCSVNARWHTISISGSFDLQYMEFRGIVAGRR